jgi:hypothetical protein
VLAVVVLGAYVAYLVVDYFFDGLTRRYHVESAATVFVLAGLALRAVAPRSEGRQPALGSPTPWWVVFPFVIAAGALYWPALGVGFLSDDFVLLARASTWELGEVTPALLRPVPLSAWALLTALHAPPPAWHALNVLLHGINGYLTARLAERWMPGRWPLMAGGLMLVAPLASEAVVWASGIFDVSATTLVLASVILARAYDGAPRPGQRAGFLVTGILAMAAKETAVVAGVLVLIDAWVRRAIRRRLLIDLTFLLGTAAVFSAIRLLGAFGLSAPPVTRYRAQRVVFESYGGLSVPWHETVLSAAPWIAVVMAVLVILLLVVFFVTRAAEQPRFVFGAAVWVLVAVAPVAPILFIAPDLQGARYLYLATPAWAGLLAGLAGRAPGRLRRVFAGALALLIVVCAAGVRRHLDPWLAAASQRDRVLAEAAAHERMRRCGTVEVLALPDNVDGAYVFRNGATEAFAATGLSVRSDVRPACTFSWDDSHQTFVGP